jgi:hypothetical protein
MMSKFFAQLLLSLVIGVGASVGFKSDVRGDFRKTLPEAKITISEKANVDLKSIDNVKTQANTSVSISSEGKGAISAKANVKSKANLNSSVSTGGAGSSDPIPNVSLDSSLNANSQTNLGVGLQDLDVGLKNTLESTLELDLNLK